MSRKEFLRLFALALLSLIGINNFISYLLRHHTSSRQVSKAPTPHGFGSRTFGS